MSTPAHVGLLGGGVIGGGWAARFLVNGIDVTVFDPAPETAPRIQRMLDNARRAYGALTLAPLAEPGRLRVTDRVAEAVADADFVQESAPEREDVKRALLAEASRAARPEVVIASSTSGLLPTRLQADCAGPERVVVGHPFNPVYLMPLVEVVGGQHTDPATRDRAAAVYRAVGMHPLIVRREIDAFIADRLMEALWREALHLVDGDIATVDEIDQAVAYGPGLRWSFMGTFLTYRLAGGAAGMRHFLAQFGPALKLPWTHTTAPELTEALIDKIADQSDAQAGHRAIEDWERLRDDCLVAVLQGLRSQDTGAGRTLKDYEALLFDRGQARAVAGDLPPDRPLVLCRLRVRPDWVDYNDHMTESRYLQVFGDASDAFVRYAGFDDAYLKDRGSFFTVETHLRHLAEVSASRTIATATQVLGADTKRVHVFHTMTLDEPGAADHGRVLATAEHMLLHVAVETGRAGPWAEPLASRIAAAAAAHADLPTPEGAGRRISMG